MVRVQNGEIGAYQELIRRYQRRVFRVISGYHRDPEDALEVLQDTFLKVYTARETWAKRSSFSAWLYRIAINSSIDRYRQTGRERTTRLDDVPESRLLLPPSGRHAKPAFDRLRDVEKRRLLEDAIRRLPTRQREVISLRYFAELRLEEVADVLGCPLGTVKSNLHKAVSSLKGLLHSHREVLTYE